MPSLTTQPNTPPTRLPFPPLTTTHILACSYHNWHPIFRRHTPKARLIPLPSAFLHYLRADGIILPSDTASSHDHESDSGFDSDSDTEDNDPDVAATWRPLHDTINATIRSLGGKVLPKLNWSAPQDATWISATNSMTCTSADEVYLLLKSSDFITHDLEHTFDGCADITPTTNKPAPEIPYCLVLRKQFEINPTLEFRCFIRNRRLIAISQREMNYFPFLEELQPKLRATITKFAEETVLREEKWTEENFVLDVYIPPPFERCWIVDFNPWAERTDALLFSWLEVLRLEISAEDADDRIEEVFRIPIGCGSSNSDFVGEDMPADHEAEAEDDEAGEEIPSSDFPEFRLVERDDPEAYQFAAKKYSAHKLPREVVDASMTPSGMKDMMEEWRRVMAREEGESSD